MTQSNNDLRLAERAELVMRPKGSVKAPTRRLLGIRNEKPIKRVSKTTNNALEGTKKHYFVPSTGSPKQDNLAFTFISAAEPRPK